MQTCGYKYPLKLTLPFPTKGFIYFYRRNFKNLLQNVPFPFSLLFLFFANWICSCFILHFEHSSVFHFQALYWCLCAAKQFALCSKIQQFYQIAYWDSAGMACSMKRGADWTVSAIGAIVAAKIGGIDLAREYWHVGNVCFCYRRSQDECLF